MDLSAESDALPSLSELEFHASGLDLERVAACYRRQGCLVVRGLMSPYLEAVSRDIAESAATALRLLDRAEKIAEGWRTPDGTLFISAPAGYSRDKQIMVLAAGYATSAALLRSAQDPILLDIVEAILGPNIELFLNGQCLYKEPVGGHPKHLHQDSSYFEHRYEGPVAALCYAVDTDSRNGQLRVVPGSHQCGTLKHVDTFSHLGLDPGEWPWERSLPIPGEAGDVILFHYRCIHGSQENFSDAPRPVFIHRYRRPDDYVIVSATSTARRAEGELSADRARKQGQVGWMVRGYRHWHPEPE